MYWPTWQMQLDSAVAPTAAVVCTAEERAAASGMSMDGLAVLSMQGVRECAARLMLPLLAAEVASAVGLEPGEACCLLSRGGAEPGSLVPLVRVGRLVEEGEQGVVIVDGDRVVLVGVALCTAKGQPHPGRNMRPKLP